MCSKCGGGRLITILTLAGGVAGGFVAGHYTARPVTFNFIGSRIDPPLHSGAPRAEQSAVPVGVTGSREAATSPSTSGTALARPLYTGFGICGAPTKSGKSCQRRVRGGGYCWQHRDRVHG